MTVWFTSDQHLFHRAVAYDRRYGGWPEDRTKITPEDVEWHNDLLAENWDKTVKYGDVVWVLGDLIANPKSLEPALEWVKQRAGEKHFILGNHDPAHPMSRESHKWQGKYLTAFKSVQQSARRRINGQEVLLSHFPYEGDGEGREDRSTQFRLRNEGLPLLHGHVHSKDKLTHVYSPTNGEEPTVPQIHVGLDAWDYTPVSLDQVAELLV